MSRQMLNTTDATRTSDVNDANHGAARRDESFATRLRRSNHRRRQRGALLVYELITMIGVIAILSLGVDVGHVQLVKTQLRAAADAASLAAGASINRGESNATAITAAIQTAAANYADGTPVVIDSSDVTLGHWDPGTQSFVANGTPIDAAQVCVKRTAAKGNAVSLSFASIIGVKSCNATATSVARANDRRPSQAFVGLDYFASRGLLFTDSYSSGGDGSIASNGNIKLNLLGIVGLTWIDGDATPGPSGGIIKPWVGVTKITGSQAQLSEEIVATPVDAGYYATHNNNAALPPAMLSSDNDLTVALVVDIPSGTYYVRNFTVLAGAIFRVNGAATFYVTGSTTIVANILTLNNDPTNLTLKVAGSGPVTMAAALTNVMTLYAPQSALSIAAGGIWTGSFTAKSVDILGTSYLHYSEALKTTISAKGAQLVS